MKCICHHYRRSTTSFRRKLFGQPTNTDDEAVAVTFTEGGDRVAVHPLSSFRKYWEIATILLVVYTVVVLPFRAAFYVDYYRDLEEEHNLISQLEVLRLPQTDPT